MGKSIWDTRFGKRGIAQDEYVQVEEGDSWKTIHGAKVLLGPDGRVKAGAGGKFDGSDYNKAKEWAQTRKSIIEAQKGWKWGQSFLNAARTKTFHDAFPLFYEKEGEGAFRKMMDNLENSTNRSSSLYYMKKLEGVRDQLQQEGGNKEAIKEIEDKLKAFSGAEKEREAILRQKKEIEDRERKARGLPVTDGGKRFELAAKSLEAQGKLHKNIPQELSSPMSEKNAISHIGGHDETEGSCMSAACALIANQEKGLNVLDFQGGESRGFVAGLNQFLYDELRETNPGANLLDSAASSYTATDVIDALDKMDPNVNYLASLGTHASLVRKNSDGAIEYLELQLSKSGNYWKLLVPSKKNYSGGDYSKRYKDGAQKLESRFKVNDENNGRMFKGIVRADIIAKTEVFNQSLPYINTASSKQKKD